MQRNIYDYFFVCGIPENPNQTFRVENEEGLHVTPVVLEHYPQNVDHNKWVDSVQVTLTQLCHPRGLAIKQNSPPDEKNYHTFLLTREDGFRSYGHVMSFYEEVVKEEMKTHLMKLMENELESGNNFPIFVEKSVCLISRFAYINTTEKILHELFTLAKPNFDISRGLSIESYLYNLLFELPLPSPGNSLALGWNQESSIVIQQPSFTELPLLDLHLSSLFKILGASNILRLLTSVFLEQQILLISRDCSNLMLVAESIRALMFPFQWQHTYAPVLPYKLAHDFVYAPVPYIMGIEMVQQQIDLVSNFDQCVVDIDSSTVQCPEDQPNLPNLSSLTQQLDALFSRYGKKSTPHGSFIGFEGVSQSPPIHRRNAQKKNTGSFILVETDKPDIEKIEDISLIDDTEDLKNLHAESHSEENSLISPTSNCDKVDPEEIVQQCFNTEVRETVLGSLVSLFNQYDKFVIHPNCDHNSAETWFLDRAIQQNFDKASFLSDQAEFHLKFLSAFLETQTFASLIDNCIAAHLGISKDRNLKLFDERIKQAKSMPRSKKVNESTIHGSQVTPKLDFLSRSFSIISAGQSAKASIDTWIKQSEVLLKRRFENLSGRYPRLKKLLSNCTEKSEVMLKSSFPNITCPSVIETRKSETVTDVVESSQTDSDWHQIQETKKSLMRQLSTSEFSPDLVAQTNWKFLAKLLKDVKLKTKKLLVRKMGQEAIELGHAETDIMGLEENTLIGSLCDLLERIWNHGLHTNLKRGKSALWSHLLKYVEDNCLIKPILKHEILKTVEGSVLVSATYHRSMPSIASNSSRLSHDSGMKNKDDSLLGVRGSQSVVNNAQYILPVSHELIASVKKIQELREVQTDVGKCRAWIRLSLECKQLQAHLKKLLSNRPLLQTLYKRFSLLRCEDERDQFLFHLLSLKAVDFSCFTNSFVKTAITYHVWIFPKKQMSGASQTSANVYIVVSGDLNSTSKISVPKGCLDFSFEHLNLGVLTGVLLGHDNSGMWPKWLIDFVVIRNDITGQAFHLPCYRWLARNIDDGSIQRLLLADAVPLETDLNQFLCDVINSSDCKTALLASASPQSIPTIQLLQENLGQSVNSIVKHFHRSSNTKRCSAFARLICGPTGLVSALLQILHFGLKSRFFRKQMYAWDVISSVCQILSRTTTDSDNSLYKSTLNSLNELMQISSNSHKVDPEKKKNPLTSSGRDEEIDLVDEECKAAMQRLLNLHALIGAEKDMTGLGKDDMFQVLICVGLKEHYLSQWFQCICRIARESTQLYEKNSLICNTQAATFVIRVLNNLSEYKIYLDPILFRGLNSVVQN